MRNFIWILITVGLIYSCDDKPITVEFQEIENNIAKFYIENSSDRDISSFSVQVKYFSGAAQVGSDTLVYGLGEGLESGEKEPFLKSGESTNFSQQVPMQTDDVEVRLLNVGYMSTEIYGPE